MEKRAPAGVFDAEYSTQWRDEVDFLTSRGIYYTFHKVNPEYGVHTWKYMKTADLFVALTDFYLRRRRNLRSSETYYSNRPEKTERSNRTDKSDFQARPEKPKQLSFLTKEGNINPEFDNGEQDGNEIS